MSGLNSFSWSPLMLNWTTYFSFTWSGLYTTYSSSWSVITRWCRIDRPNETDVLGLSDGKSNRIRISLTPESVYFGDYTCRLQRILTHKAIFKKIMWTDQVNLHLIPWLGVKMRWERVNLEVFAPVYHLHSHANTPTLNSEWVLAVRRTPCTLWCPSGAWVSVRSLLWTSLHRPNATSHTNSSREPSVTLGLE